MGLGDNVSHFFAKKNVCADFHIDKLVDFNNTLNQNTSTDASGKIDNFFTLLAPSLKSMAGVKSYYIYRFKM